MKFKKLIAIPLICIMVITLFGRPQTAQAVGDMTSPAMGQICLFPYNTAPLGWMECDGRTLNIRQYSALYSLLGTVFGGNGTTTFNIPNLTNKSPMTGTKYYIATMGMYGIDEANPAIGEVCLLPGRIVSADSTKWKLCDGSSLSMASYSELFSVIGINYGGVGSNFKLPNILTKSPLSGLNYYIAISGAFPTLDGIENETYIGSIDLYAFSFIPSGSVQCNGQTLATNQHSALYSLIGTSFGGTSSNFAVPNGISKAPSLKMKYCMRVMGIYPSSN